jgi:branched-chain amino acid transport system substrate-binding protein
MRSQGVASRPARSDGDPRLDGRRGSIGDAMSQPVRVTRPPSTVAPVTSRLWTRRGFVRHAALALVGALTVTSAIGCTLAVPLPPTPTAAPSARVGPDDVVIGAVLSLSGRFSRQGALMKAGYETWLDAVRRAGGLNVSGNRRPVRVVYADDESEPLTASLRVDKLVADPGTRLLLGPYSSQMTGAMVAAADKQGALVVAPDGSGPGLFRRGFKLFVSVKPLDNQLLHGLADLASTVLPRAQPIGVLLSDELPLSTDIDGFRERAKALGLDPVQIEAFAPGAPDLSGPLERLGQRAPRLLVVADNATHVEGLASHVQEDLAPPPMRALTRLPASSNPLVPMSRYDGALFVEVWSAGRALSGPVIGSASEFAAQFQRLHGYAPDAISAAAAAAGLALQLGIERAGSLEPAAIRGALGASDVQTFWGRLAWDVDGRLQDPVIPVLQQRGDAQVMVYPPELAASNVRYPLTDWPRQ